MPRSTSIRPSGDPKETGRRRVLDAIRAAGQIARIDIARATGFSPATVTAITTDLVAAGLIEEAAAEGGAPAKLRRGRPRVTLGLRGAAHRIAGVKVAQRAITVLILDFAGAEIADRTTPLAMGRLAPQALADAIVAAVEAACQGAGLALAELSGVAIGLAGQIAATEGFVHWSSSLSERNVALGALLAERLPCPAFIDNDANLVAKAEHLFGEGRGVDDFLVVTLEYGVGLGIMLGGEIYRGIRGCGAEFGHTKVQLEGALCQCGQRGCLEAYVGDYALLREANAVRPDRRYDDVSELFAAASAGDAVAVSVLDRAGRMFALGLANLINIFDPALIILAGERLAFRHLYDDRVLEEAGRLVVQVDAPMPPIRVHGWGDLMWAKGAAAYGIEQVSALAVRDGARDMAGE